MLILLLLQSAFPTVVCVVRFHKAAHDAHSHMAQFGFVLALSWSSLVWFGLVWFGSLGQRCGFNEACFWLGLLCLEVWFGLFSGSSDWGVAGGLGWYGWVGLARLWRVHSSGAWGSVAGGTGANEAWFWLRG